MTMIPKVLTGRPVFLECAANGIPTPTISWLKDGMALHIPDDAGQLDGGGRFQVHHFKAQREVFFSLI